VKTIYLQVDQLGIHFAKVLFNDSTHLVSSSNGAQIPALRKPPTTTIQGFSWELVSLMHESPN
jgi:hypothetical protein